MIGMKILLESRPATDSELTAVYNVGTKEAYSFNELVELTNDVLKTDIDPECIETAFNG